jgi:hypothetical protein
VKVLKSFKKATALVLFISMLNAVLSPCLIQATEPKLADVVNSQSVEGVPANNLEGSAAINNGEGSAKVEPENQENNEQSANSKNKIFSFLTKAAFVVIPVLAAIPLVGYLLKDKFNKFNKFSSKSLLTKRNFAGAAVVTGGLGLLGFLLWKFVFKKEVNSVVGEGVDRLIRMAPAVLEQNEKKFKDIGSDILVEAINKEVALVCKKITDGAKSVGNKAFDGAKTLGNKAFDGAKSVLSNFLPITNVVAPTGLPAQGFESLLDNKVDGKVVEEVSVRGGQKKIEDEKIEDETIEEENKKIEVKDFEIDFSADYVQEIANKKEEPVVEKVEEKKEEKQVVEEKELSKSVKKVKMGFAEYLEKDKDGAAKMANEILALGVKEYGENFSVDSSSKEQLDGLLKKYQANNKVVINKNKESVVEKVEEKKEEKNLGFFARIGGFLGGWFGKKPIIEEKKEIVVDQPIAIAPEGVESLVASGKLQGQKALNLDENVKKVEVKDFVDEIVKNVDKKNKQEEQDKLEIEKLLKQVEENKKESTLALSESLQKDLSQLEEPSLEVKGLEVENFEPVGYDSEEEDDSEFQECEDKSSDDLLLNDID